MVSVSDRSAFQGIFCKADFYNELQNRLPWLTEKLRTQIKDKNSMDIQLMLNPDGQRRRTLVNILSTTNPLSYGNNCNNSIVIPPVTLSEVRENIL